VYADDLAELYGFSKTKIDFSFFEESVGGGAIGFGRASTVAPNTIHMFLDSSRIEADSDEFNGFFKALVCHESLHVFRDYTFESDIADFGIPSTAVYCLINEGLSSKLETLVYGERSYCEDYTFLGNKTLNKILRMYFALSEEEYFADWRSYRNFLKQYDLDVPIYRIGSYLIDRILEESKLSLENIIKMPDEEIYKLALKLDALN